MRAPLHLTIATPTTLLVESEAVRSLRAMDESGSFGILPGHADLLTVLPASVVQWREDDTWRYCAVRAACSAFPGAIKSPLPAGAACWAQIFRSWKARSSRLVPPKPTPSAARASNRPASTLSP
ncbi:MAG: hypothetical protein R3E09_04945 [Novosphingobium sp.]